MKKNINKKIGKHAQVTIFVILAIAIVAVLLIFLLPRAKNLFVASTPDVQLKSCMNNAVKEGLDISMKQGGTIQPKLYYNYLGESLEYLCYTNEYYKTCIMQKPLLKQSIEKEVGAYAQPKIDACVKSMKENLKSKGYTLTSEGTGKVDVSIIPDKIISSIDMKITTEKDSTKTSYTKFSAEYNSKIYDLIMIAVSIANWEAGFGDADTQAYMNYYHNLKVEKLKQSDGTKIYIITDLNTKEVFQFASRSISWPPGY